MEKNHFSPNFLNAKCSLNKLFSLNIFPLQFDLFPFRAKEKLGENRVEIR